MTYKQAILTDYRLIVMELETLERQSKFLSKYIGGPKPLHGVQLTGMPRGTNDPEAAMLQREDDDPIYHIEELSKELGRMVMDFEAIVNEIKDRRLFIIVRNYYALGWTDERSPRTWTCPGKRSRRVGQIISIRWHELVELALVL